MTESSWARLYRLTEERRAEKGLTRNEIHALGGPSSETMRKLRARTEPPSLKQRPALDSIDKVLGWPADTAWRIARGVSDDAMTPEWLAEEDEHFVHMPDANGPGGRESDIRHFATMIQAKLRDLPADEADALMLRISTQLGILG